MSFSTPLVALFSWPLITLIAFCVTTPRRAVIFSIIAGWLFLPSVTLDIEGLPDFSKETVTSFSALLCVMIFDARRLTSTRPKWFDLPIFFYCIVAPIASRLVNDLPVYEGFSTSLDVIAYFGIPYVLGRLYFNDFEGIKELAMGVVLGGLAYSPLCAWEIKMSPQLNNNIYGITGGKAGFMIDNFRWGGFRPIVFCGNGLVLSMWMTCSAVTAFWLWSSGAVKELFGIGFGWLTAWLITIALLCKSSGAMLLLLQAIVLCQMLKRLRKPTLVVVFISLPLIYIGLRTTRLWDGEDVVSFISTYLSKERSDSLKFRLDQENLLVEKALRKMVFGWSGYRGRVQNAAGQDISVTDGFWVLIIGDTGLFGLLSFVAFHSLPQFLLVKRISTRDWRKPEVAPAAALAMSLNIYMIDNLLNATLSVVTTVFCGALMGLTGTSLSSLGTSRKTAQGEAEGVPELVERLVVADRIGEAEEVCREAVGYYENASTAAPEDQNAHRELASARNSLGAVLLASGQYQEAEAALGEAIALQEALVAADPPRPGYRKDLACSLNNLGNVYLATGRHDEAEGLWRAALDVESALAAEFPDEPTYRRDLADALDHLSRLFHEQGRTRESAEARHAAVEWWASLANAHPDDPEYRDRWADGCNDLAWALSRVDSADPADREAAVRFAHDATNLVPDSPTYWNTLGVSLLGAEAWEAAVDALERASSLNKGGTAFELYPLAIAYRRLGHDEQARRSYEQAEALAVAERTANPDLLQIRARAAALLSEPLEPADA